MAASSSSTFSSSSFIISCVLLLTASSYLSSSVIEAQTTPPLVKGLSWSFYKSNCANLEKIVRDQLKIVFKKDIVQAAGLLRLHFHDCFVQGCDGSVLLDGYASGPGEKSAAPNLSLRAEAFRIINDLRARVHKACGRVVSCSDITALAARDAVYLVSPDYKIPLGRKDGLNFATTEATENNLPAFFSNASVLISDLKAKNLDITDLVALSGGHTIGRAGCTSFTERLYPTQDKTMDPKFAANLKGTCPKTDTTNTTVLDIITPNVFDNKYYTDLVNRQGLFTSDQDLFVNTKTRPIVNSFAANQTLFFEKFVFSMIKMGQLSVLTGAQGEIRANCSARNPSKLSSSYLSSVVDEEINGETEAFFSG
ncbi:peroxidase 12-like [Papaver somniferum]|uniref:peroxidase 12-like n=1 Tax=Papaver somniferum TaxID=3469 RepID=UPI000E700B30|nr:peroxidase 12-like [Papaver somniferum]